MKVDKSDYSTFQKSTPTKSKSHDNDIHDFSTTPTKVEATERIDEIYDTRFDDDSEREINYLPTLIYSPFSTSKGIQVHHCILSYEDMEELNKKLEDLFLSDSQEITELHQEEDKENCETSDYSYYMDEIYHDNNVSDDDDDEEDDIENKAEMPELFWGENNDTNHRCNVK